MAAQGGPIGDPKSRRMTVRTRNENGKVYVEDAEDGWLEVKYGLPPEVIFCKSCVVSNQRATPSVIIQDQRDSKKTTIPFADGLCQACAVVGQKDDIDWEARERELIALLDRHRSRNGSYDCLIPGSGGCSRLVKLIGPAKAKRLVMTGEMIAADAALALGLVDEVIAPDALMNHAVDFAESLAKKAPLALGMAKLVINQCLDVDLATGRNLERLGQSGLKLSEDHREGAQAFIEKRPPDFKGR